MGGRERQKRMQKRDIGGTERQEEGIEEKERNKITRKQRRGGEEERDTEKSKEEETIRRV